MPAAHRPDPSEFVPYYGKYIGLVPDGSVVDSLETQIRETSALLRSVPDARASHRYAPGKWSVKEVVGHLADGERVFAYRALRFARNDGTPLPGFDENLYAANSGFDARPLGEVASEYEAVRQATLALFRGLGDEAWLRRGIASENPVSVRALAWIIAGHELHHRAVLRERYLTA